MARSLGQLEFDAGAALAAACVSCGLTADALVAYQRLIDDPRFPEVRWRSWQSAPCVHNLWCLDRIHLMCGRQQNLWLPENVPSHSHALLSSHSRALLCTQAGRLRLNTGNLHYGAGRHSEARRCWRAGLEALPPDAVAERSAVLGNVGVGLARCRRYQVPNQSFAQRLCRNDASVHQAAVALCKVAVLV